MMDDDELLEFVRRGMTAQNAIDELTARQPCPFCGSRQLQLLLCEAQAEQNDGTHQAEQWHVVVCDCMAAGRPSPTPAAAWLNWNRRAEAVIGSDP